MTLRITPGFDTYVAPGGQFVDADGRHDLINNTMDVVPARGDLAIGLLLDGRTPTLWVRDTEAGISPSEAGQIFTPCVISKPDGNGIGLAASRRVVEAHRGAMASQIREGHGTVFEVRIPPDASRRYR